MAMLILKDARRRHLRVATAIFILWSKIGSLIQKRSREVLPEVLNLYLPAQLHDYGWQC